MANGGGQTPHGLFHAKAGWWNAVLVFVVAVSSLTSAGVLRAQLTDNVLAQVAPLTVGMSSPAPGTTVTGVITLFANTNHAAEAVSAFMNGGTLQFTLVAGSPGTQWQASWHTTAMANGSFTFQLRAMKSGTVVEVPVTYNISNQTTTTGSTGTSGTISNTGTTSTTSGTTNTTTTTTTAPLTVGISAPAPGTTVSGTVNLVANTNQFAESVNAIMNGGTLPFTLVSGSQGMQWQATWHTGAMSNGSFSFLLRAAKPGVIAESAATFNIFNQTTTSGTSGSGTATGTTSGTTTTTSSTATTTTSTDTGTTGATTSPNTGAGTAGTTLTETTTTTTTTTVQPTTTTTALSAQIAAPAAGSSHSGKTVELAAKAAGVPTSAGFRVGKRDGSLLSTLRATLDAGRQLWVAAWDLTQVVNGEYLLEAFVSNSSQSVNSAKVAISILKPTTTTTTTTTPLTNTTVPAANTVPPLPTTTASTELTGTTAETAVGTATTTTQVVVKVVHPSVGLVLHDTIELAARVSATVRGLGFSLTGGSTSAAGQSGVNAIFDQARQLWVAKWDSRSVADGAYVIGATARVTDTSFVPSENRVSVSVKNSAISTTNLVPPTETTIAQLPPTTQTGTEPSRDGLTAATQPSLSTVTETGDAVSETAVDVATPTTPKFLEIIQPQPGPVRGALPILVNAAEGAVKVVLTIAKPNLREGAMTLNAFYSSGKRMWTSLWNSYFGDEGEYLITAEAAFNDGSSLRSRPVPVRVVKAQPSTMASQPVVSTTGTQLESDRANATGLTDGASQPTTVSTELVSETLQIAATPQITSLIAPETVRQTIREVPLGTTVLISREISSEAGTAARKEVNDACVAANIPSEKCHDWLASRRGPENECHAAGILTKEECAAFMQKKYDGRPPACAGLSAEDCAKVMARAGASLISTKELKVLENAIVPRIGTVLRLGSSEASASFKIDPTPPSGEPAGDAQDVAAVPTEEQTGMEQLPLEKPKTLADYVPFRQDSEASLRVVASPLYAQSEGDSASSQVPAVLVIDSDEDGLTDDLEERLGTFPGNPDSDDDGFSDGDEIKNGTDPKNEAADSLAPQIAPVDIAMLSGLPLEQPKVSGEFSSDLTVASVVSQAGATPDEKTPLTLTGKAKPGDIVTIYIYSYLPVVLTTTAGADGTWSYDLDQPLVDGQHEAYVAITDETGKIQGKSNPLAFFVNEAKAATAEEYFAGDAQVTVQEPVNTLFKYYLIGAALLLLLAAGLGWSIFRGRGGSGGIDTASFS